MDESNTCHWACAILAGMGLETSSARTVWSRRGGAQGSRSRLRLMVPTAHPKPQAQTFSCSAGCSTSVSHPWRQAQPLRRFSCRRLAPTVVGAALFRAGRPAAGCIVLCTMGWHALQHGMPTGALRTRLKKPLTLSSREHPFLVEKPKQPAKRGRSRALLFTQRPPRADYCWRWRLDIIKCHLPRG